MKIQANQLPMFKLSEVPEGLYISWRMPFGMTWERSEKIIEQKTQATISLWKLSHPEFHLSDSYLREDAGMIRFVLIFQKGEPLHA